MAKQNQIQHTPTLLYGIIVLFVILTGIFAYLYIQTTSSYNSVRSNYTILQKGYDNQGSQLSATKSNYTALIRFYNNLSSRYNITEYNLTHPYNMTLYSGKTINLPKYNSTFSYTANYNNTEYKYIYNITYGVLNYSFNALYPGYVIFNATSTSGNIPCSWTLYITPEKPYYLNQTTAVSISYPVTYKYIYNYIGSARLTINSSRSAWSYTCPLQDTNYILPVDSGMNYIYFTNTNSTQPATITFDMKYVGFHTN